MVQEFEGKKFLICVENNGCEASLELWKVYEIIPDPEYEKHGDLKVIDEEGEVYLYPARYFAPVMINEETARLMIHRNIDC
ncbi:MAG: hypothetical protein HQM12_10375 [SAR324 cluster bacterium]|nr:hypothetical protein [SAR324 cluster bacterium]